MAHGSKIKESTFVFVFVCWIDWLIDWLSDWVIDYPDLLSLISCVITNALSFRYYRHWTYLPSVCVGGITWTIWCLYLCRVSDILLPVTKYFMLESEGPPVASEVWRVNYSQSNWTVLHQTSSCPLYDRLTVGTYSLQTSGPLSWLPEATLRLTGKFLS